MKFSRCESEVLPDGKVKKRGTEPYFDPIPQYLPFGTFGLPKVPPRLRTPVFFSLIKLSISCGRYGIGFYEYFIEA